MMMGIDALLTSFFILEALIKSIAYGFYLARNSYLKNKWNQLDFFIICSTLL